MSAGRLGGRCPRQSGQVREEAAAVGCLRVVQSSAFARYLSPDIYVLLKMIRPSPWAFVFFGVTYIFKSTNLVPSKG